MTIWQKIIKYLAIIFAMMIIINIIGGIASGLTTITSLFSGFKNNNENVYIFTVDEINEIDNLKIDLKTSNLVVKSGDTFSIHTNNRYVKQILNNESLTIKENGHFNFNSNNEVIITIPNDKIFNKINISMGAGNVNSENLASLYLNIDAGAGNISFDNLSVTEEFDLNGGAGNITINNSQVKNLDLDNGIGEFKFSGYLFGNNEIDIGVGNASLYLNSDINEYNFYIDKGIGNITINDEKISDGYRVNNDANIKTIKIDGGVGNIIISSK